MRTSCVTFGAVFQNFFVFYKFCNIMSKHRQCLISKVSVEVFCLIREVSVEVFVDKDSDFHLDVADSLSN